MKPTQPNMTRKAFSADVKVVDGERAVTARVTTASVDRDGEVVVSQGINSKEYEKNPILMLQHDYYRLPIGKCTAIKREEDGMVCKFVFAARPETHPEGAEWEPDTIFSLYQQGVLNAFSIGFIPLEPPRSATDKDMEKYGAGVRRVIGKAKLLEISAVAIPANAEAVALAVSKGLKPEAAKALFGYEPAIINIKSDNEVVVSDAKADDDKPAMATCDTCGGEYPVGGTCEACAGKAAEEEDEEKAPEPVKTYAYFIPPPTLPVVEVDIAGIAADMAKRAAGDAVSKARGIVYVL